MDSKYSNPDNDPEGDWRPDNATASSNATTHPGMVYGIQNPFTGEIQYPTSSRCWASERPKMKAWLEAWGGPYESRDLNDGKTAKALVIKGIPVPTPENYSLLLAARGQAERVRDTQVWPQLWFGKNGEGRPNLKRYINRVKKGKVAITYWADEDYDLPVVLDATSWDHEESGHSQTGVRELDAVVGPGHGFETVKPLRLFTKIIQLWCPPKGLVIDPFAGSGTTGHAVLEMNALTGTNRRFILIEQGRPERGDSYAKTLTADRLQRVVTGDWANGKGEALCSGFKFLTLGNKVDATALLQMERDEMVDTVIASHFDSNRRRGAGLITIPPNGYRYLVARNIDNEGIFLVWGGANKNTDFTEEVYESCSLEAEKAGLKPFFHVYARLYLYQSEDVDFYQIPDRILADFGLNLRNEAFHEVAE